MFITRTIDLLFFILKLRVSNAVKTLCSEGEVRQSNIIYIPHSENSDKNNEDYYIIAFCLHVREHSFKKK